MDVLITMATIVVVSWVIGWIGAKVIIGKEIRKANDELREMRRQRNGW